MESFQLNPYLKSFLQARGMVAASLDSHATSQLGTVPSSATGPAPSVTPSSPSIPEHPLSSLSQKVSLTDEEILSLKLLASSANMAVLRGTPYFNPLNPLGLGGLPMTMPMGAFNPAMFATPFTTSRMIPPTSALSNVKNAAPLATPTPASTESTAPVSPQSSKETSVTSQANEAGTPPLKKAKVSSDAPAKVPEKAKEDEMLSAACALVNFRFGAKQDEKEEEKEGSNSSGSVTSVPVPVASSTVPSIIPKTSENTLRLSIPDAEASDLDTVTTTSSASSSSTPIYSPHTTSPGSDSTLNKTKPKLAPRDLKKCQFEDCTKYSQGSTKFCIGHGGGRRCTYQDCTKGARDKLFCAAHGGGRRCSLPNCKKSAVGSSSLCTLHGGGRRCSYQNCMKSSQSNTNYCVKHGGGKLCSVLNCNKVSRGKTNFCASHGGGVRCVYANCKKLSVTNLQMCRSHSLVIKSAPEGIKREYSAMVKSDLNEASNRPVTSGSFSMDNYSDNSFLPTQFLSYPSGESPADNSYCFSCKI